MEQGKLEKGLVFLTFNPVPRMYILKQIPSEAQCRKALRRVLFGRHVFCPRCGSRRIKASENRWRCQKCRKPFSLKSVSWMKSSKLSFQQIWVLLHFWQRKTPLDQAGDIAGVSEPTVRNWYERFRARLPESKLTDVRLSGTVQADEFYRKGYAIIGAKQVGAEKKLVLQFLSKESVDRTDAVSFAEQYIKPDTRLQTDGAMIYRGIANWWPLDHHYERHNRWEFELTSEIEGMWGNFATFIRRMYHHVTLAKASGITREFMFRYSFPEYFLTETGYWKASLARLERMPQKRGRMREKFNSNFSRRPNSDFPFILTPKTLASVPSC